MILGDAFFFADKREGGHLWFVISDPKRYPDDPVVIVNITSDLPGDQDLDRSCYLNAGDHPFIRHRSRVRYRDASAVDPRVMAELEGGQLIPDGRISDRTLIRIHQGAERSDFIPNGCLDVLRKQCLVR